MNMVTVMFLSQSQTHCPAIGNIHCFTKCILLNVQSCESNKIFTFVGITFFFFLEIPNASNCAGTLTKCMFGLLTFRAWVLAEAQMAICV